MKRAIPVNIFASLRTGMKNAVRKMRHPVLKARLDRLQTAQMQTLVNHAAQLEPGVLFPGGPRKASLPPHAHDAASLIALGARLEEAVGPQGVEGVVLVSALRNLSGAARCGMKMAHALRQCAQGGRILLIPTDAPADDMRLPAETGVELVNFAAIIPPSTPARFRQLLLLDLLRGTGTRHVVVANSALGWNLLLTYGRQLRHWMHLYAYMFCWDIDSKGRRKGYPLMEFPRAFSVLDGAFFDANALREEIIRRHMLPPALQERLLTVHTPLDNDNIPDLTSRAGARLRNAARLDALWAGRLDRQKRPDLAVEIARRLPRMRLHMYGRPVFGGTRLRRFRLPANVSLPGEYRNFTDLPLREFDFLLYTAQWDGLPTILLEAAVCGLPIVAPLNGGIGDILDDTTGWPVPEPDDPQSYVDTIHAMADQPQEVARRVAAMRERVLRLCNGKRHASLICGFLSRTARLPSHPPPPAGKRREACGLHAVDHCDSSESRGESLPVAGRKAGDMP